MYSVLKINPRKLGAALQCEFLDLVHFLQAEIDLDADIWSCRIPLIIEVQCLHSHGHTLYMPPTHASFAWYII